jgi:hypothetical protein
LQRLQLEAVDFLEIVDSRLKLLEDLTPYKRTIERLELFVHTFPLTFLFSR